MLKHLAETAPAHLKWGMTECGRHSAGFIETKDPPFLRPASMDQKLAYILFTVFFQAGLLEQSGDLFQLLQYFPFFEIAAPASRWSSSGAVRATHWKNDWEFGFRELAA